MYLNNSNKSESKRVYLNVLTKAEKDAKTKKKVKLLIHIYILQSILNDSLKNINECYQRNVNKPNS